MTALVTGSTGLVGCHAAIALLESGERIVALVRRRQGQPAEDRVLGTLGAYPGWNGRTAPLSDVLTVEGDMLAGSCGMDAGTLAMLKSHVDVIVNCAGEVSFDTGPAGNAALDVNTVGVGNVVDLARRLQCRRILHVSTAYVNREPGQGGYRTPYEQTKLEGERILVARTADAGVEAIIVRPSIVTGDRTYGYTPTFNGLYPFFLFGADYWPVLRHLDPAEWFPEELYAKAAVNLVPGELLGRAIAQLARDRPARRAVVTFVNPRDWPVRDLAHITAGHLRAHAPAVNPSGAPLPGPAAFPSTQGARLLEVYQPYFFVRPRRAEWSDPGGRASEELGALTNAPEWIRALLDWGMKVNWQTIV